MVIDSEFLDGFSGMTLKETGNARLETAQARRLRRETTMTLKWIAQRLQMGSWTYVSNLVNGELQPGAGSQEQLALV